MKKCYQASEVLSLLNGIFPTISGIPAPPFASTTSASEFGNDQNCLKVIVD